MREEIFAVKKPLFVSSNNFLARLKRGLRVKKAGFSGTLDPFACGNLVVATGNKTRLFEYLRLEPKTYIATLWLGAKSDTLDIEGVYEIDETTAKDLTAVQKAVEALTEVKSITPPKYCAKWVNGVRSYELARKNIDFELSKTQIEVFYSKFLAYSHPFVTFEVSVSKGTYIRSLGEMVARSLGENGALSYLCRASEGVFDYKKNSSFDIFSALRATENRYKKDKTDIIVGKKLIATDFEIFDDGVYYIKTSNDNFSIIEIKDEKVSYKLNNIEF